MSQPPSEAEDDEGQLGRRKKDFFEATAAKLGAVEAVFVTHLWGIYTGCVGSEPSAPTLAAWWQRLRTSLPEDVQIPPTMASFFTAIAASLPQEIEVAFQVEQAAMRFAQRVLKTSKMLTVKEMARGAVQYLSGEMGALLESEGGDPSTGIDDGVALAAFEKEIETLLTPTLVAGGEDGSEVPDEARETTASRGRHFYLTEVAHLLVTLDELTEREVRKESEGAPSRGGL